MVYDITMNTSHLAGVDLNLLVVLRELARTRSTTLTASRLGRTQSAVSHALARLREVFDDELFVRSGGALQPTALVEELSAPLDEALGEVGALLTRGRRGFDPARLERTFTIGATDYAEILVLPHLVPALRQEAPGVDLALRFLGDEVDRALTSREVDLAIGTRFRPLAGVVVQEVGHQAMRVLVRKGHPLAKGRLTIERYVAADHALVTPRGRPGGAVDTALEALGLSRRVVLRVPHFAAAALVVAETDLVVTLPASFAIHMAELVDVDVLPVPFELPGFDFAVAFSAASKDDPAHAWFRALTVAACKAGFGQRVSRTAR